MFWWMFLTFVRYSTTSILYLIYLQTAINLYNKLNDPVSNCSIPYTNYDIYFKTLARQLGPANL